MAGLEAALALPGLIDVTVRSARIVHDKIKTFRGADKDIQRLEASTEILKQGQLYLGLEACRAVSRDRNFPNGLEERIRRILKQIKKNLDAIEKGVGDAKGDTQTFLGKLQYTFGTSKGTSHRQLTSRAQLLESDCRKLRDVCFEMYILHTLRSSHLWKDGAFTIFHEDWENRPGDYLPKSSIYVAEGCYCARGKRNTGSFILEDRLHESDLQFLCARLSSEKVPVDEGILPVLGYRKSRYKGQALQLIFELDKSRTYESLENAIHSQPGPDLSQRLELCLNLARAIQTVHNLDLVHESLRPKTILLASRAQSSERNLYLQDWTYARQVGDASWRWGPHDWQNGIYQHPTRQGRSPNVDYEPSHDLYSVGVCMLEILLWTPFVIYDPELYDPEPYDPAKPERSCYRICKAFEECGLRIGQVAPGQLGAGDLACRVKSTKAIWEEVARSELRDGELALLISMCLGEHFGGAKGVVRYLEDLIAARSSVSSA